LIGGYEAAKEFILKAIKNGKHIVTANKALLAMHGEEIYAAARKRVEILYEAAVDRGIPVLSAMDINFDHDFGYKIKLLAIGKRDGDRVEARVHPTMIPVDYPLANVDGLFNAIRFTVVV
jgi:homoserine dehydrogenase